MTRALITGIAGQDGLYLSELLLAEGYEVHGVARPGSVAPAGTIVHEFDLMSGDIDGLLEFVRPDEVYNLAAVSSVFRSWQEPELTARVNGELVARLLAAVARAQDDGGGRIRFVQASSAEIFGIADRSPQDELTTLRPTSPYGAAKAYAHQLAGVYRGRDVFASSCVLYNHESPRRPEAFVTRKITASVARISLGLQARLELGNLDSRRDWGWAPDYVDALHRAALAETAGDYVIATGIAHSVRDFVGAAFARVGIRDWQSLVDSSDELLRTGDAPELVGDASKARAELGWQPTMGFEDIVGAMVDADLALLRS